jgi:hypothetical protein
MNEREMPIRSNSINPDHRPKIEKTSNELQEVYLDLVEENLKKRRNDSKLSDDERNLEPIFDDKDKSPSYIDKIREFKNNSVEEKKTVEKVWVVVDFDDVISKSTTYYSSMKNKLYEMINLEKKEFEKLYEESKIIDDKGKKILRFNILVEKIKEICPDKKELIDKIVIEDTDPNEFIDQGIKRALLAIGNTSTGRKDIRISILTFGDINFQRSRIDRTDVDDVVDDIIYTEGSKREILEALLEKDYKNKGIIPPIVITLDDSKEQIKDYDNVSLSSNFINMHYRNPQGKKSMEDSGVKEAVNITEKECNEGALDFYRICEICSTQNLQLSKEELYKAFNDKDIGNIYHSTSISTIGRKKASRTNNAGFTTNVIFKGENYSEKDPEMSKVIDKDGFTLHDYYMSLNDPVYIASQFNIKYSKNINGDICRSYDFHRPQENKDGVIEDIVGHKENILRIDEMKNKKIVPIFSMEELIKSAK